MLVINAEKIFDKADLFYCYSPKLKKFLCKTMGISYIGKGTNSETKNDYWLFIRCDELSEALIKWSNNAEKGIKAIE